MKAAAVESWSFARDRLRARRAAEARPSAGQRGRGRHSALRTSSYDRPEPASAIGIERTRTAGCCPPPTVTCPTPAHLRDLLREDGVGLLEDARERERRRREREDHDRRVGRVDLPVRRARRQVRRELAGRRGDGRLDVARGAVDVAVQIELERDLTSCPSVLDDVISVTPAMRPKRRSSGVATADAIVSGLAPGKRRADLDRREVDPRAAARRAAACRREPGEEERDREERWSRRAAG